MGGCVCFASSMSRRRIGAWTDDDAWVTYASRKRTKKNARMAEDSDVELGFEEEGEEFLFSIVEDVCVGDCKSRAV